MPGKNLGIHAHNDSGVAVANSVLAVQAGVTHVQGTFNGYGERCGNANLSSIIPNLKLPEFQWGLPFFLLLLTFNSLTIILLNNSINSWQPSTVLFPPK